MASIHPDVPSVAPGVPLRAPRHTMQWLTASLTALTLSAAALADERVILERKSRFNSIVVTEDESGLRVLRFERGGARQTAVKLGDPEHLELPYARLVPIGLALADNPRTALVVGLGGGTLPSLFRRKFPELTIDAVEIDPEVVSVAKSHFGYQDDRKMRCYVDDGRRFIAQHKGRYDVIVLDAFGTDSVPHALTTREFLQSVEDALTGSGVVVGNVWGPGANPLFDSMIRTYQEIFPSVIVLDVEGAANKLVIGYQGMPLGRDALIRRARTFAKLIGYRYDLGRLVERGLQHDGSYGLRGRVLSDASAPH